MKRLTFVLLLFVFITTAYGQNTEFSVHFNSGLYSYGGESATQNSIIIISDVNSEGNYTNNPYGTQKKISYGFSAQLQRITSNRFVFGLQSGYEVLRSQVGIVEVAGGYNTPQSNASGQTLLINEFVNIYPNFGRRFIHNDLTIDLAAGPELGFNMGSREKGEATMDNGTVIKTDRERNHTDRDYRLRSSVTVYYNNLGISTGYSFGVSNYSGNLIGANRERFSRFIRFGLSYRIK